MIQRYNQKNIFISIALVCFFVSSVIIPSVFADIDIEYHDGFDKGVTWKPFVPMKKTTFVEYDDNSLLDDYGYLASVPASVFYDEDNDRLFSQPLLYFTEERDTDDFKKRSLNDRQGIEYFMQDWMGYSHGSLDKMTLINVDKSQLNGDWDVDEYTVISQDDPFSLASDIALADWSYSDKVVIAAIDEEYEIPDNITSGTLTGTIIPKDGILREHFEVPQTNEIYPIYNEFNVPEGYKFLKIRSWYPCFYFEVGIPGFEGIINMSIPAGDRDIQVYCEEDGQWMMAAITSEWNAKSGMDVDKTSAYVYKSGRWSVALTDVPTKSATYLSDLMDDDPTMIDSGLEPQKHRSFLTFHFGRYGTIGDVLRNLREVTYQVDVEMYPGIELTIPESPPFGCRDISINLTWDNPNIDLGFSLIGPSGEEVLSTREPGVSKKCGWSVYDEGIPLPPGTETDLTVNQLGECLLGESYKICVFSMSELQTSTDFTIEYSWKQNFSKKEGDCLASATEGAVLASELNAPLLYISTDAIPKKTMETLYILGVKQIYLVNIGDYLSSKITDELSKDFKIVEEFTDYEKIYHKIRDISKSNDVVFSTIDPFTYWYVAELEPKGEKHGARSIGPAAYLAAHHGTPVILLDNHPELSTAVAWHTEFWRRHPDGYSKLPTVSEMYLTGKRVYDFLKEHDFDKEGEESIITLAGQFDIGLPWDRVFAGKAKPGRFIGSPTDIAVWISKSIFYPMIVFENPALKESLGVTVINGSSSVRRFPWRGSLGLKITKPSGEEIVTYPVLDTLVCYDHKFNSRASKYWGFTYKCADQTIPGISQSFNPIDEGVMEAVNGENGAYLADLSGSEVQPFYLRQGGYTPVYSTNFEANMYNLNQGMLLWLVNTHGAPLDGGMFMFWDVNAENPNSGYPPIPLAGYKKETNPWRGYEWLLGSTEEPDTMTSEIHGILPALMGNPDPVGTRIFSTALDWATAYRPVRDAIGMIASLPIIRYFTPDWLQDTQDYYDGVIITVLLGRFGTSWYNGTQIDDALGNIHSTGVSSVACLPAGKYMHLTLMRHGSPFQIMDPWATSWYSDVWQNGVPRGIALGQTIGEIYTEGITKVGIQYVSDDEVGWWWDLAENVCLYGDPDLRVWVPSTTFSTDNHWTPKDIQPLRYNDGEEISIDGHTPFGALSHPHQREPSSLLTEYGLVIGAIILIGVLVLIAIVINKKSLMK